MKFYWKGIREYVRTYVETCPRCRASKAIYFARLFADCVVRYHDLPTTIVSDRDPHFVSEFWRLFCRQLGIKRALSSAWHPQTGGQTERANRTIEQMLRTYIQRREEEWPDLLPALELAYNRTSHSATDLSPFEAVRAKHFVFFDLQDRLRQHMLRPRGDPSCEACADETN
ncbi:hypothetical protein Esti_006295 [Eimeria stiedai]